MFLGPGQGAHSPCPLRDQLTFQANGQLASAGGLCVQEDMGV